MSVLTKVKGFFSPEESKYVTKNRSGELDNPSFQIVAATEIGFWEQWNYQELLLTPACDATSFDIADLVVKAKAERHSKKFRRQAASILHERRSQWQLYEVEIFNVHKVKLKYFNYRTENHGIIRLDLTRKSEVHFFVNQAADNARFDLFYMASSGTETLIVREFFGDDDDLPTTYTFEDGKICYRQPYRTTKL